MEEEGNKSLTDKAFCTTARLDIKTLQKLLNTTTANLYDKIKNIARLLKGHGDSKPSLIVTIYLDGIASSNFSWKTSVNDDIRTKLIGSEEFFLISNSSRPRQSQGMLYIHRSH